MEFSHIICVPDLLRGTQAFPHGFFDLIREPILQGCNLDIAHPPDSGRPSNLLPGFELATFYGLIHDHHERPAWEPYFHAIPQAAEDYLLQHIPSDSLMLSFEMPPWLINLCESRHIPFIDIRVSPLRFGRDLYIALRTSDPLIYSRLSDLVVKEEELRLEAAHLAANVNLQKRRLEEAQRFDFRLDAECIVFIGQAPYDASLIRPDGDILRCEHFAERIQQIAKGRVLLHKAHPFAVEFSEQERNMLSTIVGLPVQPCLQNAYQLLSANQDIHLLGISSGLLQEAAWFGKTSHTLFQPFVPLAGPGNIDVQAYQQVHYHTWTSPGFWHQLLTPERPTPRLLTITTLPHHYARETLDQWWDYAKVLTWERTLPYESFVRAGGGLLKQRVHALEQGDTPFSKDAKERHAWPHNTNEECNATALHAWEKPSLSSNEMSPPSDSERSRRWAHCLDEIQQKIKTHPQQFGRGDLYQGHEAWGIPGQRPTLLRIEEYQLEKWLPAHAKVLDIGCNIGMFGLTLSTQIEHYYGFDNNPLLIDIARQIADVREIRNCRFECESFQDFSSHSSKDARFNVILSFAVHVWIGMHLADYAKVLHDLLEPGGIVVWESNRLDTNDKDFFQNVHHFIDAGFSIRFCGSLKDDDIIERGFYILAKESYPA